VDVSNPYSTPAAQGAGSVSGHFYTMGQVALATLLGGPLAGGYLVASDHWLFGAANRAKLVLGVSFAVLAGALALGYLLAQNSGTLGFTIGIVVAYRVYAQTALGPSIDQFKSSGGTRYSWWRVIGLSLLALVLTVCIATALVLLLPQN
jgi:hypothetical protein